MCTFSNICLYRVSRAMSAHLSRRNRMIYFGILWSQFAIHLNRLRRVFIALILVVLLGFNILMKKREQKVSYLLRHKFQACNKNGEQLSQESAAFFDYGTDGDGSSSHQHRHSRTGCDSNPALLPCPQLKWFYVNWLNNRFSQWYANLWLNEHSLFIFICIPITTITRSLSPVAGDKQILQLNLTN